MSRATEIKKELDYLQCSHQDVGCLAYKLLGLLEEAEAQLEACEKHNEILAESNRGLLAQVEAVRGLKRYGHAAQVRNAVLSGERVVFEKDINKALEKE